MCSLCLHLHEVFTPKEWGGVRAALKPGQDCQGVLQAAKPRNIHSGMSQPAEEPALHHPTSCKRKKINPFPVLELLSTETPPT